MKSTTVRGTPINQIGPKGSSTGDRQGFNPQAAPKGYTGTVNTQFQGDQSQQPNPSSGTPYNSGPGNPDDTRNLRQDGRYGVSPVAGGADANTNDGTGGAVMFSGVTREAGYNPKDAAAMDSPVTKGSPALDTRTIRQENLAHMGQGVGAESSQSGDEILNIGGVMSR